MTMRRYRNLMTLAIAALFGSFSAGAQMSSAANITIMQNGQNSREQKSAEGANGDKSFVKKSLQGGMAEIEISKLALEKSTNQQLKHFAQQVIDDHTKLAENMKTVATQVGVKAPKDLDKKDKVTLEHLQSLAGEDFDKTYVTVMLDDHQIDAAAYKQEATNGYIPVVKDAALKGDAVIENHLQRIQAIASTLHLSKQGS